MYDRLAFDHDHAIYVRRTGCGLCWLYLWRTDLWFWFTGCKVYMIFLQYIGNVLSKCHCISVSACSNKINNNCLVVIWHSTVYLCTNFIPPPCHMLTPTTNITNTAMSLTLKSCLASLLVEQTEWLPITCHEVALYYIYVILHAVLLQTVVHYSIWASCWQGE